MKKVAIIGGGVAGLAAARRLTEKGFQVDLYDKNDRLGGRVASDRDQSFTYDRGFQVLLEAYPLVQSFLRDTQSWGSFKSGAMVWLDNAWLKFDSPMARPFSIFYLLRKGLVTLGDCLKLVLLGAELLLKSDQHLLENERQSIGDYLDRKRFSHNFSYLFLRPFFRATTLDTNLEGPAGILKYILKCFIKGRALLPIRGIDGLIDYLKKGIPDEWIHLNSEVEISSSREVKILGQQTQSYDHIIDARSETISGEQKWNTTSNFYFEVTAGKLAHPDYLYLLPESELVSHFALMSQVAPGYAPSGSSLLSVTSDVAGVNADDIIAWFKAIFPVIQLRFLKSYEILRGAPKLDALHFNGFKKQDGIFYAGDSHAYPALQGAFNSGVAAANAILKENEN